MRRAGVPYMPQLDGLRAFAVSAVLVHHLMPASVWPDVLGAVSWGQYGVRLFFVLSGFLITGLLIQATSGAAIARGAVMKQFYIRRALRIFPIYYLVLGAAFVLRPPDVPEQLPWLATYTYNFWISYLGWYPGYFAHFWTLCVEEQFYLLWPWLLVFAPRRYAYAGALAMVVASPVFRALAIGYELNEVAYYTLTPASLDALGLGALLALHTRGEPAAPGVERRLRTVALPLALIGVVACLWSKSVHDVFYDTFVALAFLWLVAAASHGFRRAPGRVLEAPPVLYLGRISYGVYVYHLVIQGLWKIDPVALGVTGRTGDLLAFAIYCAATIAVASLSWFALERPINRLKNRWAAAPGSSPIALAPGKS